MDQLNVRLFGRLNVESEGRSLGSRDFGGIKPRQIFEILALSRGHAVPKDKLADMLWGELLPQNVSGALETYVSVLRRSLCPEGRHGHTVIVTEPEAYRLATDLVDVDLDRFDALLAQAAGANGAARGYLESAIELARGDVLEDEPYAEWVLPVRERYQERRLQALADAGSAALAHADHEAALAHAAAAIQLDSVNEPAYRVMMLAYNALDRPQDALRAYDRCRRELERVLETTPSQAIERLYLGIRDHDDLTSLATDTPAETSHATAKRNGSHLLGRVRELDELGRTITTSLKDGGFALAFVEGEPGIGKSRLIHEAVASVNGGTRIGKASCSRLERSVPYAGLAFALREALDGLELEPVCAAALGRILPELALDGSAKADDARALEALVSVVRSVGPILLVLDDLQHADPATITAINYLSRRCQGMPLTIIAGFRQEEVDVDDPLRALEPTVTLRLEPLSRRELAAAGVAGLYDRTGGHPLLVAALMSGDGELPQQTAHLLLKRCRSQGLLAFRLLSAASVLAQPFSPEVLGMITEAGELQVAEVLDTLCERGLLQVQGLCFMFRFPVLRDVLRRSLTPFARTMLSARAETAGADAGGTMLAAEAS